MRRAALAVGLVLTAVFTLGVTTAPPTAADETDVGVIERDDMPGVPLDSRAKVDWGIVSGTVYFNLGETSRIAAAAPFGGAVCAAIGALGTPGKVLGVACGLKAAEWVWVANVAKNEGRCMKIKFGVGYREFPAYRYGGGYCTK